MLLLGALRGRWQALPIAPPAEAGTDVASTELVCPRSHFADIGVPEVLSSGLHRVPLFSYRNNCAWGDPMASRIQCEVFLVGAIALLLVTAPVSAMVAYLDRSYYTSEQQAAVIVELSPDTLRPGPGAITVRDARGRVLVEGPGAARSQLPLDLGALLDGRHELTVEWAAADGTSAAQTLTLVKRPPRPGFEWKIDNVNRNLLRDGEPWFSVAMCYAPDLGTRLPYEFRDGFFNIMQEAGIDTCVLWSRWTCHRSDDPGEITPERMAEILAEYAQAAEQRGLFLTVPLKGLGGEDLDQLWRRRFDSEEEHDQRFREAYEEAAPRIVSTVAALRDRSRIMAYYTFDQPRPPLYLDCAADLYDQIQEVDGYRPVYTDQNIAGADPALTGLRDPFTYPVDVLGRNTFICPVQAADGYRSVLSQVQAFNRVSRRTRQPVWVLLTAENYSRVIKRPLSLQEHYCQAWLALIHGARGIHYWRYPFNHRQTVETLAEVVSRLRTLSPMVLAPEVAQQVRYEAEADATTLAAMARPQVTDADLISVGWGRAPVDLDDEFADVQARVFADPAGGYVLLAANYRTYPIDVTITVPGLDDGTSVRELFSDWQCPVAEGGFSDRLERYGVRAYRLPAHEELAEPVVVAIEGLPHPDRRVRELFMPEGGRVAGGRNVICNPGFEEASVPGWPDYFFGVYSVPLMGGTEEAGWGQDARDPWEGQQCLRIVDNLIRSNRASFLCVPQHEEPTPYVFSVYLRADRDGVGVRLQDDRGYIERREVTLTTRWQRYWTTGTVAAHCPRNHFTIQILPGFPQCTVWADAVQVEQGLEPTEFEGTAALP